MDNYYCLIRLQGDVDVEELRTHLLYNGYKSELNCGAVFTELFVYEEEYEWIKTILDDRDIFYRVYFPIL